MKNFKIHIQKEDLDFQLEVGEIENKEDWDFIKGIMSTAGLYNEQPKTDLSKTIEVTIADTEVKEKEEEVKTDELDEKLRELKEGYNFLKSDTKGLHNPPTEYKKVPPIDNPKDTIESTQSFYSTKMAEAFSKAKEVRNNEKEYPGYTLDVQWIGRNIKVVNGEKRYQTYYICPECKHKGKTFSVPTAQKTSCFNCKHTIELEPATENGPQESDRYGNFLIGGEFKRVGSF